MRALLLLLLLQCTLALAAETGRPTGRNCDLSAPPDAAGEEFDHGITLRIYPRARDIDSRYSGCQIMWAPEHGQRVVLTMTVIESGDPVRIWSPIETDSLFSAASTGKGRS